VCVGSKEDVVCGGETEQDDDHEEEAKQSFLNLAGEDGELDAFELKNILDAVLKRGAAFVIVGGGKGVCSYHEMKPHSGHSV